MSPAPDWLERVGKIRAWSRNGVRAPHKPLLLLYALGRLQRDRVNTPVTYRDAEVPLRELLDEFGPPRATSPSYPFHHLTSDGLWVVRTEDGEGSLGTNVGVLRSSGATGMLDPAFGKALLADPALVTGVARGLLDANFPPSLHEDIAAQVGLDLFDGPTQSIIETASRRRSPQFRDQVLMAYEARCAMCGWDCRLGSDVVALEAAHVRWFNIGGPDALDNGLCLCSLHHRLLDQGAVGITSGHTIAVSARFVGRGAVAEQLVLDLVGKELAEPQTGLPPIADTYISWHTSQVFRVPSRSS